MPIAFGHVLNCCESRSSSCDSILLNRKLKPTEFVWGCDVPRAGAKGSEAEEHRNSKAGGRGWNGGADDDVAWFIFFLAGHTWHCYTGNTPSTPCLQTQIRLHKQFDKTCHIIKMVETRITHTKRVEPLQVKRLNSPFEFGMIQSIWNYYLLYNSSLKLEYIRGFCRPEFRRWWRRRRCCLHFPSGTAT